MIRTIDIHTHLNKSEGLSFLVGVHSLGIHPWDLKSPFKEAEVFTKFLQLKKTFQPNMLAVGECGLDRKREGIATLEEQLKVFEWHLDWAQETKRPIIIHCVKAHSDVLMILKQKKYAGKILMHDFAGNYFEAEKFLKFNCFFSFGARLFNEKEKAHEVIKMLPTNRIFLETDDQIDFDIVAIYKKTQSLLGLGERELKKIMEDNLKDFFLDLDNISTADIINYLSTGKTS